MCGLKRSHVWSFFNENDKTKVKCILCGALISRGGTERMASTSALTNHLKIKHKEEADTLQPASRKVNVDQSSASSFQSYQIIQLKQQTIEDIFSKKKMGY